MNTGRNLTVVSVGIVLYVLTGADFRAAGIGGLSWEIEYPSVIKLAAVLFWSWLVVLHWLTRIEGDYYKAWADNAAHHNHGNVPRQSNPERPKERVDEDLAKVGMHFRIDINEKIRPSAAYGLRFVDSNVRPGIYVLQVQGYEDMDRTETMGLVRSAPKWRLPPISPRFGFFLLHLQFPDVVLRVVVNKPEVVSRRLLPWIFAFAVLLVLLIDRQTEYLGTIGPKIEALLTK